ncbi:YppE family protein [Bacillus sp. B15-48]|uniref:YppE family protein n=1 Tax=Bacillus sp. B15-48 TaxID=1548601 RepID=UPI00193FC401|nr:YppE family protein [Bacillus sp. B15-48]MBM4762084.1 DUF1798 family protein [Bacillus sp. B15-48]
MNEEILKLTNSLLSDVEFLITRFEQTKVTGKQGDFHSEVKPFADAMKIKVEEWQDKAVLWLIQHPQRTLHSQQIESTAENLEMVSTQAFFPSTSRKRFIDTTRSINYVLKCLKEGVEG